MKERKNDRKPADCFKPYSNIRAYDQSESVIQLQKLMSNEVPKQHMGKINNAVSFCATVCLFFLAVAIAILPNQDRFGECE
ncbi:MAG: hypothetical protein AB2705_21135 [Candidatus Thiodiazotropha sp.]